MDFNSDRFSFCIFFLCFTLSFWGISHAWALEDGYEYLVRPVSTVRLRSSSVFPLTSSAVYPRASSAAVPERALCSPRHGAATGFTDFRNNPNPRADKGSKMPRVSNLSLCQVRGFSSPNLQPGKKKKRSSTHQAKTGKESSKNQHDFQPPLVTGVIKLASSVVMSSPPLLASSASLMASAHLALPFQAQAAEVIFHPPTLEREIMFSQVDEEGRRLRGKLKTLKVLQGFNGPLSFLQPEERYILHEFRSDQHTLHDDIMELVVSYVYGGCLGIDAIVHGEDRDPLLRRLILERFPKAIRFQLSRHKTENPHIREKDCHFGSSDIVHRALRIFNPEEDSMLTEINGASPYFSYDVGRLTETWRFFRPGPLFKTIAEILYRSVEDTVAMRGYWMKQAEIISLFSMNFCLLARRYECDRAYSLAEKVYEQLEKNYTKRILRSGIVRNTWMEVLLKEMKRFLTDLRFWEGEWLDFDIETAK